MLIEGGADVHVHVSSTKGFSSAMFMSYIGYPKKGAFEPFACGTGDLQGAPPLWVAAYAANGSNGNFGGDGGQALDAASVEGGSELIFPPVVGVAGITKSWTRTR